jgi:hypothetical protein
VSRKPLFPFYIDADHLIRKDPEYQVAYEKEGRFTNILKLDLEGKISSDGTLELRAWSSTDNGFCQTAGRFWSKTLQLTEAQLKFYVDKELVKRAAVEIAEEERKRLELVISMRAEEIRKELGL